MGLWAFIARRLVLAFFVLIIVSIATFLLMHAVPGARNDLDAADRSLRRIHPGELERPILVVAPLAAHAARADRMYRPTVVPTWARNA